MKVKEFIEQLQKLDQEKQIWIIYDCFKAYKPEVDDKIKNKSDASYFSRYGEDVRVGDYIITC